MLTLSVKIRHTLGKKVKKLREAGLIPAVLYGPEIKEPLALEIDHKTFEKIYKEAGESSLISLVLQNFSGKNLGGLEVQSEGKTSPKEKKFLVLINDTERDSLTGEIIHVDFYQPRLGEEIEAAVPIIFEGVAPAVKELEGTLVKNISEVKVKALPQKLPKEIKVDVSNLKTFEDHILIKDLNVPDGVKILKEPNEIVASVSPPEKAEEELKKPIEEKVEDVKKVEKKKTSEAETSEGTEEEKPKEK
jgi:large subunit ribosomal protein L25